MCCAVLTCAVRLDVLTRAVRPAGQDRGPCGTRLMRSLDVWHQPEEGLVNAAVPCSDWEQNMCGTSTGGALSHIPGGGDAGVDQQLTLRAVCSSTDIPARYRHRSRGSCRGSANAADMAVGVATCPGLVRPYESSWLPSTAACSHQSHPLSRDAFHRFAKLCTLLCRACLVRGVTQALQCSIRRLTVVECVRPRVNMFQ